MKCTQLVIIIRQLSMVSSKKIIKLTSNSFCNELKNKLNTYQNSVKPYIKQLEKTLNHNTYINTLNDLSNDLIVVYGPAGTGKTHIACTYAIEQLKSKAIEKIIITRPVVTVHENLGFLPGTINEKMDPYMRPIFDSFLKYYEQTEIDKMLYEKKIQIIPLGHMRGRTFDNSFIIADEMQNAIVEQTYMCLTRIGQKSRMVITGDPDQTDLILKHEKSGLVDLINRIENSSISGIRLIKLTNDDIKRSQIVKSVIDLYK